MSEISPKEAKAEAKAAKAKAKAMRPWFKKKRFIGPIILVAIIAISVATRGGGASTGSNANSGSTSSSVQSDAGNWYTDNYANFTAEDFTGSGDDVVTLPAGATNGLIEATYKGSANFVIEVLDDGNQTADLAVNTIGSYAGTTSFGLNSLGGEASKLKITASGKWTIHVAPFSDAPALPATGKGDGVFKYEDSASPIWQITHSGQGNFAITEEADASIMGLLVNEIGNYKGTVPASAGPSIISITADGKWSITAK